MLMLLRKGWYFGKTNGFTCTNLFFHGKCTQNGTHTHISRVSQTKCHISVRIIVLTDTLLLIQLTIYILLMLIRLSFLLLRFPINQQMRMKIRKRVQAKNLVENRARTSRGGTMFNTNDFSKNFHIMATLFSQQICETNISASSTEGIETPLEIKSEYNFIAHNKGSLPFSRAALVASLALSQMLLSKFSSIRSGKSLFFCC